MDSNLAVFLVLIVYWLVSDRTLSLCLLVIWYYGAYLLTEITDLQGVFQTDLYSSVGIYAVQMSLDCMAIVSLVALSIIYQKNIKIFVLYGAIIATSLALNGLMIYDQLLDLSVIYHLHAIRQELSIPLDVLFAVLGSALNVDRCHLDNLRTCDGSIYNRAITGFKLLDD